MTRFTFALIIGAIAVTSAADASARHLSEAEAGLYPIRTVTDDPTVHDSQRFDEIQTIDGITYRLFVEGKEFLACVIPYRGTEKYIGDVHIPAHVTYNNRVFRVAGFEERVFKDSPQLTSLHFACQSTYYFDYDINCPNLKSIVFEEGVLRARPTWCNPHINELIFPTTCVEVHLPRNAENLTSLTIKSESVLKISVSYATDLKSLSDIYLSTDVPPRLLLGPYDEADDDDENIIFLKNNVTVHIPAGTLEAYRHSQWSGFNIVDDGQQFNAKVALGYCGAQDLITNDGLGMSADADCDVEFAIRIPSSHLTAYKGSQITAIEYATHEYTYQDGLADNVEYVFIASSSNDYEARENVVTERGRWMRVYLTEPYTITGDDLFIGIGRKSNLSAYWVNYDKSTDGFWKRVMGNVLSETPVGVWEKFVYDNVYGYSMPIRAIVEGAHLPTDVQIVSISSTSADIPSRVGNSATPQIEVKLRNRSPHIVREITLDWCIDNAVSGRHIATTPLLTNHDAKIYFDLPNNLKGRFHDIEVKVASIDGKTDEIEENSITNLSFTLPARTFFPRKIVMEEAAGTWCPNCPRGIIAIEKLKSRYPENFIAICAHFMDEMSTIDNSYLPFIDQVSVFPMTHINRMEWNNLFYSISFDSQIECGDAMIAAKAEFVAGGKINVSTETMFGYSDDNADCRIAYVVTEDGVGPYMQANVYSGPSYHDVPSDDPLYWWTQQDREVEITFDDIVRTTSNYYGEAGLIPTSITEGVTYSNEFALQIPGNIQNYNRLNVVTMLIDSHNGEIINADITPVSGEPDLAGLPSLTHPGDSDAPQGAVTVYNINGCVVGRFPDSNAIDGLHRGLYIVRDSAGRVFKTAR